MRWWLVVVVLCASCVNSESVVCGDKTCPADTVCDDTHDLCVSHDQRNACAMLTEGEICHAKDIGRDGICNSGYCVPGCGDGIVQDELASITHVSEECDDGNFQSHDGCSSTCVAETPVWLERIEPWTGRYAHGAAYMTTLKKLVVVGGIDLIHGLPDDVWERDDNGRWTHVTNIPLQIQRSFPAIAYDPVRGKIVMFGGYGGAGAAKLLNDTWEYDGTTWTPVSTTAQPTARRGASLVWDSTRNKLVLFGGQTQLTPNVYSSEVWEYNPATTTWTQVTTTGAIAVRALHGMAYDSTRQRIVVFGGLGDNGPLQDTWEYAPATATWTQNLGATHPSRRFSAAMTYQVSRSKVLLFGGDITQNGTVVTYADAWEYDATGWVEATSAVRPPGRYGATLTPIANGSVILVSGATGTDLVPQPDAWELTASGGWADVSPQFPPARESPFAYDSKHAELVMFAGDVGNHPADTWAFDGNLWSDVTPAPTPPWREFQATTYDSKRDRVVLFGGFGGGFLDETWEWNGDARTWAQASLTTKPAARSNGTLAYDEKNSVSVLFGGQTASTTFADTWEYDGTAWTDHSSATGPSKQILLAMAYDPDHGRIVAFDANDQTYTYTDHVWAPLEVDGDVPKGSAVPLLPHLTHDPERHVMTLYDGNASRVWELTDHTWQKVRVIGTLPPPRYNASFSFHRKPRRLVLFGGGAAAGVLGDTWYFGYRSETLDEVCDDGADNDGDLHVDAADPDCNP